MNNQGEVRLSRTCYMCKEDKSLSEFPVRQGRCTKCNRIYSRALHYANRKNRLVKMRVATASRNARLLGVVNTLTVDQWLLKLQQAGHRCEMCGGDWEEIHHLIPMGNGWNGPNSVENVSVRCRPCHLRAHQELWAQRKAFIRSSITEKACTICKIVKPIGEFYRRERALDGHQNSCKECERETKKARRESKLAVAA